MPGMQRCSAAGSSSSFQTWSGGASNEYEPSSFTAAPEGGCTPMIAVARRGSNGAFASRCSVELAPDLVAGPARLTNYAVTRRALSATHRWPAEPDRLAGAGTRDRYPPPSIAGGDVEWRPRSDWRHTIGCCGHSRAGGPAGPG